MEYQVELKNITKSYTDFSKNIIPVLKNVSYAFEKGKFYGVMGVSGAGKSTLLNLIGLLDKADEGDILIASKKIENLTKDEMAYMRMKHIGFVFQDYYLNPKLNVTENIILAMKINKEIPKKDYLSRVKGLLAEFGMDGMQERYPKELSGGEQQRVCIVRALANNPGLILADEPTGNLDEDTANEIIDIFSDLAHEKNKCVIMVTHSKELAQKADVILTLKKGKVASVYQWEKENDSRQKRV